MGAILSGPRRKKLNLNLKEINEGAGRGKTILVPGKVLSLGELDKKMKIVALAFSEKAKEKILKSGSEALSILEEIKKNPEAKNIEILK